MTSQPSWLAPGDVLEDSLANLMILQRPRLQSAVRSVLLQTWTSADLAMVALARRKPFPRSEVSSLPLVSLLPLSPQFPRPQLRRQHARIGASDR